MSVPLPWDFAPAIYCWLIFQGPWAFQTLCAGLWPIYWGLNSHCRTEPTATAAKSLQSCPTLCDPIDSSPPGSPVPGILQARTLEWVAISFSKAWKWKEKMKSLSRVQLLVTPWTAAHQAPPSMGFSRQEYWSGVSLPSLRAEPTPPQSQAGHHPHQIRMTSHLIGMGVLQGGWAELAGLLPMALHPTLRG